MKFYILLTIVLSDKTYADYVYSFTTDVETRDDGFYFPNEKLFVAFSKWPRNLSPDKAYIETIKSVKYPDTYTMKYSLNGIERSFEVTISKNHTFLPAYMTYEK